MLQLTENLILKKLFSIPEIRNRILVKNGLQPKLDDLEKVEYLCKECQFFKDLPTWPKNLESYEWACDTEELEEQYYCPCCEERMIQTETGGW